MPGSSSFHLPSLGRKGKVAITGSPFSPEEPGQPTKGPGAPTGHRADDTPGSHLGPVSSSCPKIGRKGQALGGNSWGGSGTLLSLSPHVFSKCVFRTSCSGLQQTRFLRKRSVGPNSPAQPRHSTPTPCVRPVGSVSSARRMRLFFQLCISASLHL